MAKKIEPAKTAGGKDKQSKHGSDVRYVPTPTPPDGGFEKLD